jgi:3-phosphoinositide dependent protein kinase-1
VLWSNIISYVRSSDLKPENLLLDDDFRIKITDFGTGKLLGPGGTLKSCQCCDRTKIILALVETAKTFVGTSQYVSPELLEANETSRRSVTVHISILVIMTDFWSSSDLWALGCIIYQMIAGRFTFTGLSEYLTWQKIKQLDYSFPEGFDPEAKDLVQRLIVGIIS